MQKQVIHLGADHAGFELKEQLKQYLQKRGHEVYDEGARVLDKTDDYPDFAIKVSREISENSEAKGIICCGTAQGMCIAANKVPAVRAVAPSTIKEAQLTRSHNNANVLCLAGWSITLARAKRIVDAWLSTQFSNEPRHVRRLKKIADLDARRGI
ncbi:MAG: RpiB/LacA/LacB family sugar-phosphate isomerase [Nanoarchaeota archaeon]